MGRKRTKKKQEDLGPPPDPMPLTDPSVGRVKTWEDVACVICMRLTGRCNSCGKQSHTVEHAVASKQYKGWTCEKCCPVCNEDKRSEYDLEKVTEIIRRGWEVFPEVDKSHMPSPSEMVLIDTIKRR